MALMPVALLEHMIRDTDGVVMRFGTETPTWCHFDTADDKIQLEGMRIADVDWLATAPTGQLTAGVDDTLRIGGTDPDTEVGAVSYQVRDMFREDDGALTVYLLANA